MRKIRGFKMGKRLVRVTRWVLHRTRPVHPEYQLLKQKTPKPICKLINWVRRLTKGAKSGSYYVPCEDPKSDPVPKGYSPVYVGREDGDFHRVLVPVIYFNHPFFGELLSEAENEYGFYQQGGITIPCCFSEFEKVQTRIAATAAGAKKLTWKRHH